jgi:hypothetical protein
MKKMILSALLLVLSTSAMAFVGNDGPQAAPQPPARPLVERSKNGGFMVPPGGLSAVKLQILDNGSVVKTEWIRAQGLAVQPPKTTLLLTFSPDKIAKIAQVVAQVKPGKLVDPNPERPSCMDAPTFTDVIYQGGVRVVLTETAACKTSVSDQASSADNELIQVLNAIEKLSK